jgi:hypothetical protein
MPHLKSERLAAFDHDGFTAEEQAHLAACALCRAEVDRYTRLVQMAGAVVAMDTMDASPRLTSWESIAGALHDTPTTPGKTSSWLTSVSNGRASHGTPAGRSPWWSHALWRTAAAVALVAGGAVLGRFTHRAARAGAVRPASMAHAIAESIGLGTALGHTTAYGGAGDFASVDQATNVLNRAQREYERASLWLVVNDSTPHDAAVYRARLAALDQMMAASRAALTEVPQDPVLRQYYLAAFSAREATLQQLGTSLPVGTSIERY